VHVCMCACVHVYLYDTVLSLDMAGVQHQSNSIKLNQYGNNRSRCSTVQIKKDY
jgi:hypothetical protein